MMRCMSIDLNAAADFMATHARVLDRRRFELRTGGADPAGALAALDGYRNPDGGYGWGLEPDLRSPESQPGAARTPSRSSRTSRRRRRPHAVALCDWLDSDHARRRRAAVRAAARRSPPARAPGGQSADPTVSSLQITAVTAAARAPRRRARPGRRRPSLARARDGYCLDAIAALDEPPFALRARLLDPLPRRRAGRRRAAREARRVRPRRRAAPGPRRHRGRGAQPARLLAATPTGPSRALFAPDVDRRRPRAPRRRPAATTAAGPSTTCRALARRLARLARLRDGPRARHPARNGVLS